MIQNEKFSSKMNEYSQHYLLTGTHLPRIIEGQKLPQGTLTYEAVSLDFRHFLKGTPTVSH